MTDVDLRLGDWRTVLATERVDAVICDPPYGARTHDSNVDNRNDGYGVEGLQPGYVAWTPADVSDFVADWSPRCSGWMVALTSHDLIPAYEAAYAAAGRYAFAPVACVMRGMSCRMLGDGPSSWTVYAMAARPRRKAFMSWGTLDGAYTGPCSREAGGGRGKPDWLAAALVRDYSRAGDLVCDPFAGWGTTAAACVAAGRRFVGAEVDIAAYDTAMLRLQRPTQMGLLG